MFGPLGATEIIFIFVLALLIFGPKQLPKIGQTLGKAMGEFRRASNELKRSINTELAVDDDERAPVSRRPRAAAEADGPPEQGLPTLAAPRGVAPRGATPRAGEAENAGDEASGAQASVAAASVVEGPGAAATVDDRGTAATPQGAQTPEAPSEDATAEDGPGGDD